MGRRSDSVVRGALLGALLLTATTASAQTIKTFKHDQYSENIYEAVNQIQGQSLYTQPGFVAGEAFGAVFRPTLADYPVKLLGVDVIFSGPQFAPDLSTVMSIDVYLNAGAGPQPANPEPDFSIASTEFWNASTNEFGIPIKGNTAYQFDFNYDEEGGAPPLLTEGNVIVMVRYAHPAMSLEEEYGDFQCIKESSLGFCGCQPAGMFIDGQPTPQTNIMNIIWPLGNCSGTKAWKFFEDISANGIQLTGDAILRVRAETADPGCVGNCSGKVCGDDGCGNPCGFCEGDAVCVAGQCAACGCGGATCGTDACGNSCGTCNDGFACEAGSCVAECSCDGKSCGDDGCGGSCGTCSDGEECVSGSCETVACVPDCTGKSCGDDGCGGVCGTCSDGDECVDGACKPVTCAPQCGTNECGPDGCGGSCGTCTDGESCVDGACQAATCMPDCEGRECGSDGCGGDCGACTTGTCTDGKCSDTPAAFSITLVDPAFGYSDVQTPVSILGTGFDGSLTARLGGTDLIGVQVVNATLVTATVPKGIDAGTYSLILASDGGETAFLDSAFEVRSRAAVSACGDGVCSGSESCSTCPGDCGQCPGNKASGCSVSEPGRSGSSGLMWLVVALIAVLLRGVLRREPVER